jgi:hypothetical protein
MATFAEVLKDELELIRVRRREVYGLDGQEPPIAVDPGADTDRQVTDVRVQALDEHLIGVSFSGGGIRSGTFAVGFLQGLSRLGLLRRIDYLSTVSGGGYAGSWLAAWLAREGEVRNVERQLDPSRVDQRRADRAFLGVGRVVDEEPEPLHHLRSYSSYLTPRAGLSTVDTWTVIAIWLRNVTINLLMLVPMAVTAVLVARIVIYLYGYVSPAAIDGDPLAQGLGYACLAAGLTCFLIAFLTWAVSLGEFRTRDPSQRIGQIAQRVKNQVLWPLLAATVLLTVPIRAVSWWAGSWWAGDGGPKAGAGWVGDVVGAHPGLADWPNMALNGAVFGVAMMLAAIVVNLRNRSLFIARGSWFQFPFAALLAAVTGGVLFALLEALIRYLNDVGRPDLATTFVPPLNLMIIVVGTTVEVGLLGRLITEAEREWWARLAAMLLVASICWVATMASILYLPALFLAAGPAARAAIASGWLAATATGVLSAKTAPRGPGATKGLSLATIAELAPPIFLAGLLGIVALVVAYVVNQPAMAQPRPGDDWTAVARYIDGLDGTSVWTLLAALAGTLVMLAIASRLIDVNLFSLHAMYANRLIRCYLGASRPRRRWSRRWGGRHDPRANGGAPALEFRSPLPEPLPPLRNANPVTGFDPQDDLPLRSLRIAPADGGRAYQGPHLLVNTTLNLVGGSELAWRDRKGESFVLSPLYCGARGVGYAAAGDDPESLDNLTLGRAMTISGAAVDPNMRFYQSWSLTAFLTIFNARLGYWLQNPRADGWKAESPKYGYLLVKELFGSTDGKGDFVHLSDGGHFENLGVYELIRRRCRYIVVLDAGEDPDAADDNLSDLVRLCRIDFGVRIELDTTPLVAEGPDRLSRAHAVAGRVRYDDVDNGQLPGILLYVKISMTGDEQSDVRKYAKKDPLFPHQPTDLRQSFDEEQFECYRALGDHIAHDVFKDAVDRVRDRGFWTNPGDRAGYIEGNQRLFSALRSRWSMAPTGHIERYLAASREWGRLQHQIRTEPALAELTQDLYPELPPDGHGHGHGHHHGNGVVPVITEAERRRAELLAVGQMLQVVEDAWISLGLKSRYDLPMDRGWLNVFRRWTSTATFRRLWPTLRSECSPDFVHFCEDELHMTAAEPDIHRVGAGFAAETGFEAQAVAVLAEEYGIEWPAEARDGRGIRDWLDRSAALAADGRLPAWLIVQAPSGPESADSSPDRFACGIVVAAPSPDVEGVVDLLVWVRRPHRSVGLGSRCFRPALDVLRAELAAAHGGHAPRFRVRYPKSGRGADTDIELGMWKGFFSLYDFRPLVQADAATSRETILELRP